MMENIGRNSGDHGTILTVLSVPMTEPILSSNVLLMTVDHVIVWL